MKVFWEWFCFIGGIYMAVDIVCNFLKLVYALCKCTHLNTKLDDLSLQTGELRSEITGGKLSAKLDDLSIKVPELRSQVTDMNKRLDKISDSVIPHNGRIIPR